MCLGNSGGYNFNSKVKTFPYDSFTTYLNFLNANEGYLCQDETVLNYHTVRSRLRSAFQHKAYTRTIPYTGVTMGVSVVP